MEAEVVQFTDHGPKIMRAGQGAARGQSQPQLLQESGSADSDSGFAGNDLEASTPVYPSPEKKPSAFERPRRRVRQSA
jgi:hypothetical protein